MQAVRQAVKKGEWVKVAILSDVHANLEALTAVLEDVDSRNVDRILFLGDAVGYGADPARSLELLEKSAFRFVAQKVRLERG